MTNAQLTFPAPGPGRWRLDQDHAERPTRRVGWDCWAGTEAGSRAGYALIGAATRCIRIVHVHGWPYVQVEMIGGTETVELSKRDRSARIALEDGAWCDIVDTWFDSERGDFVDRCLTLQMSLDEPTEDLTGRAEDVLAAGDLATDGMSTHFKLVAGLLGAGLFLGAHAAGSERQDALAGLAGASPGSSEPLELAAAVANTLGDDAHHIRSLRAIVQHSPEAARQLGRYLELFGSRSLDGTPDGPTLLEAPDVVIRTIQAAAGRRPAMSQQLEQIPADVRRSYRLRDDNVGITCNWPAGLLRRATAGAGGALRDAGLLDDPALAFHLSVSELAQACDERANRWNEIATARAIRHRLSAATFPPVELDGDHVSHTRAQLPEHVARVAAAFMAYSDPLPRVRDRDGLRGIGVGSAKVRGRARVVHDALEASEQIEPDEILVTNLTDSAFNALLPMVAGLVTAHGGAMSHAALMARELGISAIVGVDDAVSRIPDGCLLELDPTEGIARMVNASGPVTGAE